MFTIENDMGDTIITILDETAEWEDVQVVMSDTHVFIRQWCNNKKAHEIIAMTPHMYYKLMQAWNLPDGAYTINYEDEEGKVGTLQYGE